MHSPAPHQPFLQNKKPLGSASDPVDDLTNEDTAEPLLTNSNTISLRVHQTSDRLEAIVENCGTKHVRFFLGDNPSPESLSEWLVPISCVIEAPVELHSPTEPKFEETVETTIEENTIIETEQETSSVSNSDDLGSDVEARTETCVESVVTVGNVISEDNGFIEEVLEAHLDSQDEDGSTERTNGHIQGTGHSCPEVITSMFSDKKTNEENSNELTANNKQTMHNEVAAEVCARESVQHRDTHLDQMKGTDSVKISNTEFADEDKQSLRSSNESIVSVSDEESVFDEADTMQAANGDIKICPKEVSHWSEAEASSIFKLHMNGCPLEKEIISIVGSVQEEIETIRGTNDQNNIRELTQSSSMESSEPDAAGDFTENSDFSILETSCVPELVDNRLTEQEVLSSVSLDASEESHEVDVH